MKKNIFTFYIIGIKSKYNCDLLIFVKMFYQQLCEKSNEELEAMIYVPSLSARWRDLDRQYRVYGYEVQSSLVRMRSLYSEYLNAEKICTQKRGTDEFQRCLVTAKSLYGLYKEHDDKYHRAILKKDQCKIDLDSAYFLYANSVECYIDKIFAERGYKPDLLGERRLLVKLTREELDTSMEDACSICMESHAIGETILTDCGHRYGAECFSAWRKQRNTCVQCPLCKTDCLRVTKYVLLE